MAHYLSKLMGLGPKSQAMLERAGIDSPDDLRALGAVKAYLLVKRNEPGVSLNLLWALEGAITERRWQDVARDQRTSLLLALEDEARRP